MFLKLLRLCLILLVLSGCSRRYCPPGTVRLTGNIYVDQSEIRNIDWREYIYWLKSVFGEKSPQYRNSLPDSNIWSELYKNPSQNLTENEGFPIKSKKYDDFPIVGITYNQAVEYCIWRTKIVSHQAKWQKISYRLPSEAEFKEALALERKSKKNYVDSLKIYKSPDKIKGKYILHLCDNVSEILNEQGKAMGGNFTDTSCAIKYFTTPQKWLGFRCIAEKK